MGQCLDQLRLDYGRGLTDDEITEIFSEAKKLYEGVMAAKKASNQNALAQKLAAEQAEKERIAQVLQKRNTYLQLSRKLAIIENVSGNWQGREWEGFSAMLTGSQKLRDGARLSVDSIRSGLKGEYVGGFLADLSGLGRAHYALFKKGSIDREIAQAMWTIDNPEAKPFLGSSEAMDIARVAHKWQEKARLDENRVGGFINALPGYIVRQSHDSAKIGKAGYEAWKAEIEPRLDWRRTADGLFDPDKNPGFKAADKEKFLFTVFQNLQTGEHMKFQGNTNPLASGPRVGSLAARVSQERVLHFRDGGAWFDYNAKFGTGTLRDAMLKGFVRAADNTALMRVFGPSPQANLENSLKFVKMRLRKKGDAMGLRKLGNHESKLWDEMAELDGSANIPAHSMLASVGRNTRGLQTMAKLGQALLSSFSDWPVFAYEMAYQGKGFLQSMGRGFAWMIRGRGTAEQRRVLSDCGVFFDSMCGDIISRFSGNDSPGKMSAMLNLFFRMNGLSLWTDSWKKAACLMMAHDLGQARHKAFGELLPAERRLFRLYGIDEGQWDMLRGGRTTAADGRDYLTPRAAFDASDEAVKAYLKGRGVNPTKMRIGNFREEMAGRLRTLYRDRTQYAVLEPDAGTNAFLRQGTRPGALSGELLRFFTQFKSFPAVFMQRALGREIYGRGADSLGKGLLEAGKGALAQAFLRDNRGEFSNFAGLIVMMTIFGYASMTAKQLLAGKTPRPLDDPKTWMAAMAQGGGLGIYGDFLFGEKSRMGGTLASTFGGPTYSTLEDLTRLYYDARDGKDIKANSLRFLVNNTPGNNLFYVRGALDYTLLNNFYEYLNPGYLRRMRRRIEKENRQTFYRQPAMRW